jgi:type I restriction enzyme R subunit
LAEDVDARRRALFPHTGLYDYDKQENAINSIYRFMQDSKETPDVSEMLQALYDVVDLAVDTEPQKKNTREEGERYDLSHIDMDRLKAEFDRNCPNIKVMTKKEKLEKRLRAMIKENPSRADLYEKYQQIIAEYNQDKDDAEIQRVMDELDALNTHLSEEEKRFIREGMDNQQQLAVFDLLQKNKLTPKQREQVKQVARDLMNSLAAGKLRIENFKEKATAQAQIKVEIIDSLLASLPEGLYDNAEVYSKADEVFTHLLGLTDSELDKVVLH